MRSFCEGHESGAAVMGGGMENTRGGRVARGVDYWLISGLHEDGVDVLTLELARGGRALPVFSFEEEAAVFLRARGDRRGVWRVERKGVSGIIPVLSRVDVEKVLLDPMPEVPADVATMLVGVDKERFAESLLGGPALRWPGRASTLADALVSTPRLGRAEGTGSRAR